MLLLDERPPLLAEHQESIGRLLGGVGVFVPLQLDLLALARRAPGHAGSHGRYRALSKPVRR